MLRETFTVSHSSAPDALARAYVTPLGAGSDNEVTRMVRSDLQSAPGTTGPNERLAGSDIVASSRLKALEVVDGARSVAPVGQHT